MDEVLSQANNAKKGKKKKHFNWYCATLHFELLKGKTVTIFSITTFLQFQKESLFLTSFSSRIVLTCRTGLLALFLFLDFFILPLTLAFFSVGLPANFDLDSYSVISLIISQSLSTKSKFWHCDKRSKQKPCSQQAKLRWTCLRRKIRPLWRRARAWESFSLHAQNLERISNHLDKRGEYLHTIRLLLLSCGKACKITVLQVQKPNIFLPFNLTGAWCWFRRAFFLLLLFSVLFRLGKTWLLRLKNKVSFAKYTLL